MPGSDESIELTMYIDYIQIDKQEQSLFNTNEIDYLFDHTERPIKQKLTNNTEHILLHFTKPVKELIIVFVNDDVENVNSDLYDFLKIDNLVIKLNNIKLETSNDETYFRLLQPYFHNRNVNSNSNIYMYSFAFDPDSAQPTGSYNFGNLKSKELTIHGSNINNYKPYVYIYANTNNVLKVSEGQAQVQFI